MTVSGPPSIGTFPTIKIKEVLLVFLVGFYLLYYIDQGFAFKMIIACQKPDSSTRVQRDLIKDHFCPLCRMKLAIARKNEFNIFGKKF